MSVNQANKSNNGNTNTTTQMGSAFNDALKGNTQQASAAPESGFSLGSLGSLIRSPLSRTAEGECLAATNAAFSKVLEATKLDDYKIDLFSIDMNSAFTVKISAIVIAVSSPMIGEGVAFHTVLLDGSIEKPTPVVQQVNGKNVSVLRLASDYNDSKMIAEVVANIRTKYSCELYNADASVLSRDLSLTDTASVKQFLANAVTACVTELAERSGKTTALNLATETGQTNVTLRRLFGMTAQQQDANGDPIRADIQLSLSVSPKDNTQQSRSSEIARVNGFMDIVFTHTGQNNYNSYFQQQQVAPQRYYRPRFVATNLECTKLNTIAAQLLAFLQIATLGDASAWMRAFTNDTNSPLRDFGAIGYEVPTRNPDGTVSPKRIDTRGADFKTEHLYRLISETVENNMLFSIDIPDAAPSTWMNRVFADAAKGSDSANRAIVHAADTLTNGNFSKLFNDNVICIHEENRIPNGYYIDDKGVKRDVRDVDYLAMLNVTGGNDPSIVARWSDSHFNNAPIDSRLSDRINLIKGVLGENVVFTNYSTRVTMNPAFIDALVKGAAATGFSWTVQDNGQDFTGMERGRASFDGRFNANVQFANNLNRFQQTSGNFGSFNNNSFRF